MQQITIQYATDKKLAPAKKLLAFWAMQALAANHCEKEITIRIINSDEMTMLNGQYRHKPYPTNVLSFPAELPEAVKNTYPLLGDLVICADVVNREANEQHKTQHAHWAHMIVHGVLHLLGHDHENDDDAEEMEALEINIMQQLGFSNPYLDGEMIKHHE